MAIVSVKEVSKCFRVYRRPVDHLKEMLWLGKKTFHIPCWAVRSVTFEVERGHCLGIIGENGSGKSTLLSLIAGILRLSSGQVEINGTISALLELGSGFNPEFTGRENIYLNASILGLSDPQIEGRIPSIERFAEIGPFIDLPLKTYSTGMFVRLGFAVAIHMDPDILIVDEALSVGDVFFQQRCIREIQRLKGKGVTILFVSHDMATVRNLADRTIWMDNGEVRTDGDTDDVVSQYLAAMVTKGRAEVMDRKPTGQALAASSRLALSEEALARIPDFIPELPNVDHRYGNEKARVCGIGVFDSGGRPQASAGQGERICIRISVEFQEQVERPNVGFMLRNHLGEDVTGTNVLLEGKEIAPAREGDRLSVDFVMNLPFWHPGYYYFAPAVANGPLDQYEMCDWVDNAYALEVVEKEQTYGHIRVPMGIQVTRLSTQKLGEPSEDH